MKKYIYLILTILLSSCGVNKDAYNSTRIKINQQQKRIEAEDSEFYKKIDKSKVEKLSYHIVLGEKENLKKYKIVAKKIINSTNAKAIYYDILRKKHYVNAVLVQDNWNMLYYVIIDSFQTIEEARRAVDKNIVKFPSIFIAI